MRPYIFGIFLHLFLGYAIHQTVAAVETTVKAVRNETVALGDRAMLSCQITNQGSKTVSWKRLSESHPLTIGDQVFTQGDRLDIKNYPKTGVWTLFIQDVRLTDEGAYVCLVTTKNNDSNGSAIVYLTVKTIQLTGPNYIEKFSPLRLVCNVSGRPNLPRSVTWLHDKHVITSDNYIGIMITNRIVDDRYLVSDYVKRRVEMSDEGLYQCKGDNDELASTYVNIINDFLVMASPKVEMSVQHKPPPQFIAVSPSSSSTILACHILFIFFLNNLFNFF